MHEALTSSLVASLDSAALARRLGELAGHERRVQAGFLLHLEAFDRRRGYLDAGHPSLWDFCLKVLHLREGAAGRRIAAMRVLRRFPMLEGALREGKLCLSTLGLLGPVLTEENWSAVAQRAAFRSRAEVERLVASMQPRVAPKDGLRKLPAAAPSVGPVLMLFGGEGAKPSRPPAQQPAPFPLSSSADVLPAASAESVAPPAPGPAERAPPPARARPELRPVSEESYSLRLTLDSGFKADLDLLRQLLSHKVPGGELAAVLREAVRCAIEKHGKRRGAVAPSRRTASEVPASDTRPGSERTDGIADAVSRPTEAPGAAAARTESGPMQPEPANIPRVERRSRPAIPAALRREVWARDGGRCAWQGEDGRRCESRWQLEFDHVVPVALGGPTTAINLRLACRAHNTFHAEQVFGRAHMARFRREPPRQGEFAIASGGGR